MKAGDEQGFEEKAFAISHAIIRCAPVLRDRQYAQSLEQSALHLLEEVMRREYDAALRSLSLLCTLARLGPEVRAFSLQASEVLFAEAEELRQKIEAHEASREENLSFLFHGTPAALPEPAAGSAIALPAASAEPRKAPEAQKVNGNPEVNGNAKVNGKVNGNGVNGNQKSLENKERESRQKTIMERIGQTANCRLKDLQDSFKEVSERTLRYDLQDLIEKGKVVRVGAGGPWSYYRLPTAVVAS